MSNVAQTAFTAAGMWQIVK